MKRLLTAVIGTALTLAIAVTVVADGYPLLNQGDHVQIRDAVYRAYNPTGASGTGVFDAFVGLSGGAVVRGYNTDGVREFDTQGGGGTHAILLSEIPIVSDPDYSGVYREVQLDINQTKFADISLDQVEIYLTDDSEISQYPFDDATGSTAELVYELDADGNDDYLQLNYDLAAGGGKRDMILRVPDSYFQGTSYGYCAYKAPSCFTWFVLYSEFGGDATFPNDDGPEEWGVELYDLAVKSGYKWHDLDADGVWDDGEPGLEGWTIYVDMDGDGTRDPGEPYDATDADGFYEIMNITAGTFRVREEPPAGETGWNCSYPATSDTYGCYHEETFEYEMTYPDNNFGNWRYATKYGYKYEDVNANGDLSDGTPVDGVTIYLIDASDGSVAASVETGAGDWPAGYYEFDQVQPGVEYLVCEEQVSPDWTQSYPPGTDCATVTAVGVEDGGHAINLDSNETDGPNDFGNWRYATKYGYKYEDVNADGDLSDGVAVTTGVTIYLIDASDGSVVDSDVTDGTGRYEFNEVRPGVEYLVCEADTPLWTQSYPPGTDCANITAVAVEVGGYAINLDSNETDGPNDFGNWRYATKYGYKYEDVDADGDLSDEVLPVNGITIYLIDTRDGSIADSDTTDSNGYYEFDMVEPGVNYLVCEEDLSPVWTQSYPPGTDCAGVAGVEAGGYAIKLDSNDSDGPNDFGNYEGAKKLGRKFEDLNADGSGEGDPGREGWTIRAYADGGDTPGALDDFDTFITETTTGSAGAYSLDLDPGNYIICEVQQDGWQQSYPTEQTEGSADCSAIDGLGHWGYAITLGSGQEEQDNDFGNWRYATKYGYKYEDVNANGDLSDGVPVNDITIYLIDTRDGSYVSAVTGDGEWADGYYEFDQVQPGVEYLVCEEQVSPDWTQSYPDNDLCTPFPFAAVEDGGHPIDLESNETEGPNNFGNWRYATKYGYKYEDLNADGDLSDGSPVEGITIYLIDTRDGGVADSDTTDGTGRYEFDQVEPGVEYLVCEEQVSPDWMQSYPPGTDCAAVAAVEAEDGGYAINLDSNESDGPNDFGNYTTAGKSGRKFHDVDADGVGDGDPGLEGWTIRAYADDGGIPGALDAGDTLFAETTTGAGGAYSFDLNPGSYIICEVQQDGWSQTFPTGQTPDSADCSAVEGLGEWGYAITLLSSQQELHNDFGNQSAPVGGATVPTDVLTLLALWIKLLALTGVMLVGAVVVTRARRALSR